MRILLVLLTTVLLAGCPAPTTPSGTPSTTPPTTPSTPVKKASNTPATPLDSFLGIWTTQDEQGQIFDIVIFPNGQSITNWTKGLGGAKGERGFWRHEANRLISVYHDGWTDILEDQGNSFYHNGFSPDTSLSAPPTNHAPAQKLPPNDPKSPFIGIWRLNKEPDGNYLYLALQSSGRAFSTINGGTEGKWEVTDKGAVCTWPDGWVDQITRGPEGWQRRSWVGSDSTAPADLSEATRVGEATFQIEP